MDFPNGETVVLHRTTVTGVDGDGNDVTSETTLTIDGAGWDPGTSTEAVQGQDLVVQVPRFFLPAGTVVGPLDVISRVDGRRYQVTGEPGDYVNPFTGWVPGVVVNVRRVTG
jgi:hypothetical protein